MSFRHRFALALALSLAACNRAPAAHESRDTVKELSVAEVATLVQTRGATLVDANNVETRAEQGIVPGAVLLTSYREFALSELPAQKDTKLVFYCGGTACRASDGAAKRAAAAGYADVAVMRAGIRGWKDAGQTTATPQS